MLHNNIIERRKEKQKPRGRPFPKGNKNGKLENQVLDAKRHSSSNEGGTLDSPFINMNGSQYEESNILDQLPRILMEDSDKTLKEFMNITQETEIKQEVKETTMENIVESLDFFRGENKLSIRFTKKHNRMFRIQIFMNDEHEVRPVTYSGSTTGVTFWNLLKGILKK